MSIINLSTEKIGEKLIFKMRLSYNSVHYNEEEFLFTFHMKKESFLLLLEQIRNRKAFEKQLGLRNII
jgi:hypothetical protein